ncbi:MAG TPA: UDP-glucose 4-epimerase GalE [Ilumatobacteraceae bacterium]
MSVLVTGGAGYIGSHTVRKLVERGDDVVVLDSLRTGHPAAVGGCKLVVGSVTDAALVAQVLDDHAVTSVIHFAGLKNPGESIEHPVRYFRANVTGTLTLLDAMAGAGIETCVFSSSCSVYGTPSSLPVDEAAPLQPESPYGESKRMGEDLLTWFGRCHGIRSISLRYFNAAGASADASIGETWEQTHNLIPLVIAAALGRRGPVKVFGTDYPTPDGTAIRDYVHVDDLADAHLLALDHLLDGGDTTAVNLGSGTGSSVNEVLEATAVVSGLTVPHEHAPRRPGDPAAVFADNSYARELLGWQPHHKLEAIVASAWRWHSTHPDGYATPD